VYNFEILTLERNTDPRIGNIRVQKPQRPPLYDLSGATYRENIEIERVMSIVCLAGEGVEVDCELKF